MRGGNRPGWRGLYRHGESRAGAGSDVLFVLVLVAGARSVAVGWVIPALDIDDKVQDLHLFGS